MHLEAPIHGLENCKLVSQGAEARVFETQFLGRPTIIKQRFSKQYRHPTLDAKLTTSRLKQVCKEHHVLLAVATASPQPASPSAACLLQEVRSILRARKIGVACPVVYYVEQEAATIYMEQIQGRSVKALISEGKITEAELKATLAGIGQAVAVLHDGGLVHGDLTTSNMLVREADSAVVLIDFGLSFNSTVAEDKGVDLYVLERAFTSAHSKSGDLFSTILDSYKQHSKGWNSTFNKYAEVRLRGRKRAMVG
eukprot:jgi/Astpho2/3059/Aster-03363